MAKHRQRGRTQRERIRSLAIALVDLQHGYTMEFNSSPAAHAEEYNEMERHIHVCLVTDGSIIRAAKAKHGD